MPRYGDDQCEECGADREPRSNLCFSCMVRTVTRLEHDIVEKRREIDELEGKNKKLTELCERLLDHVTSDVVRTGELERAMASFLWAGIEEV